MNLKTILSSLVFALALNASADTGLPLHGFLDIKAGTSSPNGPEKQKMQGFSLGTLDLYLTPEFGDKVKSLIEIALEPNSDTGANAVDLERAQLGYATTDSSTVWMGRFHTPYGFWSTAYHHGAQLQTTISRPQFIDFEDLGGILPGHTVGGWMHGTTDSLVYDVFAGNGDRITGTAGAGTLDFNATKTDKNGSIIGGKIAYVFKHGSAEGLQIGAHAYTDKVLTYASSSYGNAAATAQANVTMTGLYASYEGDKFDVDAEYFGLATSNTATGATGTTSWTHSMYFVQADMNMGKYKPFVMFEKSALDNGDTVYIGQLSNSSSYTRSTLGVRYDLSTAACVKLSWAGTNDAWDNFDNTKPAATHSYYDKYAFQYAVRF